jgi:hypothetical protein
MPSPGSGWTPEKIESARRRMRRFSYAILAVILVGGGVYSLRPQYTVVAVSAGRTYQVMSVLHNSEAAATANCGVHEWSELLVVYYSPVRDDSTLVRAADDLAELGGRVASQNGDSLLVIRRTTPVISRWIPLSVSMDERYTRVAGRWVRAANGPWPPWAQCGGGAPSKPMAS